VFLQYVLQDMIVPVCICTQIGDLFVAPLQAGIGHSFAVFRACQPVDDAVGLCIFQPFSFIDACICRVVSTDKGESPDDFSGIADAHVTVSLFDVCRDDFLGGIVASPLQHISVFPHDALCLFKDVHEDSCFCGACLSDCYHKPF